MDRLATFIPYLGLLTGTQSSEAFMSSHLLVPLTGPMLEPIVHRKGTNHRMKVAGMAIDLAAAQKLRQHHLVAKLRSGMISVRGGVLDISSSLRLGCAYAWSQLTEVETK